MIKDLDLGELVDYVVANGGMVHDDLKNDVMVVTNRYNKPVAWFEVNVSTVNQISEGTYSERKKKSSVQETTRSGIQS